MKKFLTIILASFCMVMYVDAACSNEELTKLNSEAANVKASYETVEETVPGETGVMVYKYINVDILNVSDNIYIKVTNDNDKTTKRYDISDSNDGQVRITWKEISDIARFTIDIYGNSNTGCSDTKLKTTYLTLPRYNDFHNYGVCFDSDLKICEEYVTFAKMDEETFYKQYNSEMDKQKKGKQEDPNPKEGFWAKLIKFLNTYKYIFIGIMVIIIIIFVVKKINDNKKKRSFGL